MPTLEQDRIVFRFPDHAASREGQRARYAWLRPLELLWVARTLKAGQDTGELRGKLNANKRQLTRLTDPE